MLGVRRLTEPGTKLALSGLPSYIGEYPVPRTTNGSGEREFASPFTHGGALPSWFVIDLTN